MTGPPAKLDLNKLAKICMRLGSDFPDERATAAAIADNMLRAHGLTWEILIEALQRSAARVAELESTAGSRSGREWQPVYWQEPNSSQEAIEACLDWSDVMSDWEQGFLVSISSRSRLSPKQLTVLDRLVTKARNAAKAAGVL
jgi:hypothetical protein